MINHTFTSFMYTYTDLTCVYMFSSSFLYSSIHLLHLFKLLKMTPWQKVKINKRGGGGGPNKLRGGEGGGVGKCSKN